MKIIFAVDKNWSIGYKGDMLVHIPTDLKRFKKKTTGNILVMGRKTLESLPGGKPLPSRESIVLTRNKDYDNPPAHVVGSMEEAEEVIKTLNPKGEKEVFLIGGGNLVSQYLNLCDYAYITKIDKAYEKYDTSIPNLDELDDWEVVSESETLKEDGLEYKYVEYRRKDS